ncbi:DUF3307 domain-containing protein [Streptacidiphilus carbonis]|uniref:DUF3307 domain-containing protein n=1 Tax=Streptacidiphilus carbonis TaxID=105422 RepID=UPI0005AAC790|nr:DUF3307 domain-containing protein [Streptacidiphilus carbonis]
MFADVFVILFAAHLLADYPLQTDHQAAHKAQRTAVGWRANLTHASVHVAAATVLLLAVGAALGLPLHLAGTVAALAWLGLSHGFIDRRWPVLKWMNATRQPGFAQHGGAQHVDQAAHIALGLLPAAVLLAAL